MPDLHAVITGLLALRKNCIFPAANGKRANLHRKTDVIALCCQGNART